MKIRIKTYNGELPSYLTLCKEYKVEEFGDEGFGCYIVDDDGVEIFTVINNTHHLNGGSWEVVSEFEESFDDAIALLEYNEYVDSPLQAFEVLKGEIK